MDAGNNIEFLGLLSQDLSEGLVVLDQARRIEWINPAGETILGVAAVDVVGTRLDDHSATQVLAPLIDRALDDRLPATGGLVTAGGYTVRAQTIVTPTCVVIILLAKSARLSDADRGLVGLMGEIVHDLKGPIAAAKSFIDLAQETGPLNDKQLKFIRRAQHSLEHMLSMVHELLDITWVELGENLMRVKVDLAELTRRAIGQLDSYAQNQGVWFELDLPAEGCLVEGDARRLEGALSNLINNAIKYSPRGGPVRVVISTADNMASVQIIDQGIGIAPEHLPHLYERFYRVHSPETRQIEGSGLGLSIVKAVVQKHGGEVFAQSKLGQGSVFGFWLPLAVPTPDSPAD